MGLQQLFRKMFRRTSVPADSSETEPILANVASETMTQMEKIVNTESTTQKPEEDPFKALIDSLEPELVNDLKVFNEEADTLHRIKMRWDTVVAVKEKFNEKGDY